MTKYHTLSISEAKDVVKDHFTEFPLLTISSCSKECVPHTAAVLTHMADLNTFYFPTLRNSRKATELQENPVISAASFQIGSWYVQLAGTVQEESENEKIEEILTALAERAASIDKFWPPIFMKHDEPYVIFKINVTWLRLMDISTSIISTKVPLTYEIIVPE